MPFRHFHFVLSLDTVAGEQNDLGREPVPAQAQTHLGSRGLLPSDQAYTPTECTRAGPRPHDVLNVRYPQGLMIRARQAPPL